MRILITGCAGFIGFSLCKELSKNKKIKIFGVDNINNYYDTKLKMNRLKIISKKITFINLNICNKKKIENVIKDNKIDACFHFAAQAGVRYSINNPDDFFKANIEGFYNVINACRLSKVKHFFFSSTSSVYGNSKKFPQKESDNTDNPISFYAATKKSNEAISYSYSKIYKMNITVLRFFTVYGPYGRPDMAFFNFANSIKKNKNIKLFNKGNNLRDYTYIDDVIESVKSIFDKKIKNKSAEYEVINICSSNPHKTNKIINIFQKIMNKKAKIQKVESAIGDVRITNGSISKIKKYYNKKFTDINIGIQKYVNWFNEYYS